VAFATNLPARFVRLSQCVDYVRYSMCALVTFYIGKLAKLSSIDILTHQYRGLALRRLRASTSLPPSETAEPVFAASFLLPWVAYDR